MTDHRVRLIAGFEGDAEALLAALDSPTLRVIVPPTLTWRHQLLALAFLDLIGRLFPRLSVEVDETVADERLPPGPRLLRERLDETRRHGGLAPLNPSDPKVTVAIGVTNDVADIYLDARDWQSYLGTKPSQLPGPQFDEVPFGALAAAARGAAHAFAMLLQHVRPRLPTPTSIYSSLLTYESSSNPFDDPAIGEPFDLDALLVGAGSVGGALVYALSRHPTIAGTLTVLDPQSVEEHNVDRAILVHESDADAARPKVVVVDESTKHLGGRLRVRSHMSTISDYINSLPVPQPLPLVFSAVDSAAARRSIQDALPLDLLNAACHPQEFTVSGHRTGDGPCMCCLHMAQVLDAAQIKVRLIARSTGLNERLVVAYLVSPVPLTKETLMFIEDRRGLPRGALSSYEGRSLDDLWTNELVYGGDRVETVGGGTAVVAAPFVTAIAGFMLAAEAVKYVLPAAAQWRLGPSGVATKYEEGPYASPEYARLSSPPRWAGSECICRSIRRTRILYARYGLGQAQA